MYQPISFNVIRQALEWHGFPVPILRCLSVSPPSEEGIVYAEYHARWGYSLLDELGTEAYHKRQQPLDYIKAKLQDCFCGDVEVCVLRVDDKAQEYIAVLDVKVDQTVTVLADWLNRAYC